MNKEEQEGIYAISFIESSIIVITVWACIYIALSKNEDLSQVAILSSNLTIYILGVTLFLLVYIMLCAINCMLQKRQFIKTRNKARKLSKITQVVIVVLLCACAMILFGDWGINSQFSEAGVSNESFSALPILKYRAAFHAVIFLWLVMTVLRKYDVHRITVYVTFLISLLNQFWLCFWPNPFSSYEPPLFFIDNISVTPVIESIYNVMDSVPFTYGTTGLYGHYGLFFIVPLRILGVGISQIATIMATITCVEHVAYLYVIDNYCPKNWLKALLALAALVRRVYIYPAITPIRTFWPMIICAYFVYLKKKGKEQSVKSLFGGYILSAAAVLWNVESGISCCLGVSAFFLIEYICRKRIKRILVVMPLLVGAIMLPITAVNVYNFICGYRTIIIKAFFVPFIGGGTFATGQLRCNVPIGNHAWVYIVVLLFLGLSVAASDMALNDTRMSAVIGGISTVGTVQLAYYFNEAHWGCMEIVLKICACLTSLILFRWYTYIEMNDETVLTQIKRAFVIVAVFVWSSLALSIIMTDPLMIYARYRSGLFDTQEMHEEIDEAFSDIPYNTYGAGQGIQMIYHELRWNNHANYRDISGLKYVDPDGSVCKSFVSDVLSHGSFVVSKDIDIVPGWNWDTIEENGYEIKKEFCIGKYAFYYVSK